MSNTPKLIIEESTNYAFALEQKQSDGRLSFYAIREASAQLYKMMQLPEATQKRLYDEIERGICPLNKEPHLNAYMYYFGKMHHAKLHRAYDNLSAGFRQHHTIDIVDYGCGQAMGCICYADFLRENGIRQRVRRVVLIEPSELALARAALHVSLLFPDAEIRTVCKGFDDLLPEELCSDADVPTLHILSNVLDIGDKFYDLDKFADLVSGVLKGDNEFVCVGPRYGNQNDLKIAQFMDLIGTKTYYATQYRAGELSAGESWTGILCCGSRHEKKYDFVDIFIYGFARVEYKGKFGLINKAYEAIIPPTYDYIDNDPGRDDVFGWIEDAVALAYLNGKVGIVSRNGDEIVPVKYDCIYNSHNGYGTAEIGEKWGFIDEHGQEISSIKYDEIDDFRDPAMVKLNEKWGFCQMGKEIIYPKYDAVGWFNNGYADVKLNGKWGMIDIHDNEIIPIIYEDINSFYHEYSTIAIKVNNKWAISNYSGEIITEYFDQLSTISLHDGRYETIKKVIAVALNDKWGLIDMTGKEILPIIYDEIVSLCDQLIKIKFEDKWGVIDGYGKVITSFIYDKIDNLLWSFIKVSRNGLCGLLNKKGETIIPIKYNDIEYEREGLMKVCINDKRGLIDSASGGIVTPIEFEDVKIISAINGTVYNNLIQVKQGDVWRNYRWLKDDHRHL